MCDFFDDNDSKSALDAQYQAQKIAFAPIVFQVARSMRDLGVLQCLYNNQDGLTIEELAQELRLSKYSIKVLLETSLSIDVVKLKNEKYFITKTGYFLLHDKMTNINMNYNHYVNYLGLYELDKALKNNQAEGLKYITKDHETIYPALSTLPEKIKDSWFEFDHFYSDNAFPMAIQILFETNPKSVLDIGGNTGKFSKMLLENSENLKVSILDLPEQISLAKKNLSGTLYKDRARFIEQNILDDSKDIPTGFDVIWVSQFLDCFDEDIVINLLSRIKKSMSLDCKLYIMEPLWDKQKFETSAFCIINTSPYFTAMANGYSKMFSYSDLQNYIQKSGLTIEKEIHNIGICQSIIICK